MRKRTVGTAYFSTNLDIHEMKEEFGNDLLCHVDTLPYCVSETETQPLIISMDTRSYFNGVITGLKLKPGITKNSIAGNVCGKLKQLKAKKKHVRYGKHVIREKNNVFKCTIYSKKI